MFKTSSLPIWAVLVIVCRIDIRAASAFNRPSGVNIIDTLSVIFHTSINGPDNSQSLGEGLEEFDLLPENTLEPREVNALRKKILNFSRKSKNIHHKYRKYLEYSTKSSRRVGQSILEPPNFYEMDRILNETHKIVFHPNGLVHWVENYIEELAHVCAVAKSEQLYLYELFRYVVIAELKSYRVLKSAIELEGDLTGHDIEDNQEELNRNTVERLSDILSSFSQKMISVSRQIWKCDPSEHIEDETFTELKQVFKKIILNEHDFDNRCLKACPMVNDTILKKCYDDTDVCKKQRFCRHIVDCEFIGFDGKTCLSKDQTSRRYDFIDDKTNRQCHGQGFDVKTKKKTYLMFANYPCRYCMCTCVEERQDSDHYFNLNNVESDIDSNYVVSGLRLQKVNHVVHLQIQQGKIDKGGFIRENTVSWKPINVYDIREINLPHTHDSRPIESVNYTKLQWSGKRQILLDDVVAPEGHVITGVKFALHRMPSYDNIELRIRSTKYNFVSGQLLRGQSFWSEPKASSSREEFAILNSDSPTNMKGKNLVDSKQNQFIKFTTTGWGKVDAGQSTIPFLDIQPVLTTPPVAISGIGLYHKGIKGSGGHLGLKLSTYNFVPMLTKISDLKHYFELRQTTQLG